MTEVDYGGGGHQTRLKINDQLVCLGVPPAPVYKGARGEAAGQGGGRAKGGVLLGAIVVSRGTRCPRI